MIAVEQMQETPIGPVWLAASQAGLVAIALRTEEAAFREMVRALTKTAPQHGGNALTAAAAQQLADYLAGNRREFDLPLDWSPFTPFQKEAMQLVQAIPFGQLRTYGDIARELGRPGAARAVGRANATNPIPIVLPCHRVLGSDGTLHGYGAGIDLKAWLLRLEGSWLL